MSEEITYANLKFQDFDKKDNIQELDICGPKVPPAPSHLWNKTVLALSFLCLLLLIGLGVLGGMFYATLQAHMAELSRLQNAEEELQRNVSAQMLHNSNSSAEISKLSSSLQRLATSLCRELYKKEPEHKCKPCPKSSVWYKGSCYFQLSDAHAWQASERLCSAQNASLLTIEDKSTLEFIKSSNLYHFWLGLSPTYNYIDHVTIDEKIFSSKWFKGNTSNLSELYCGYVNGNYVSYSACSRKKSVMCLKTASEVKVMNMLMSNSLEGSM
uniref:C-type lectin domain family 12 member A n=1 Tax=Jaculus jaculus TaxID=51337 RepID=UPI001E1B227A|nr:C-type lectin domain family 12 member A [Jaculus jaculus]